MTKPASRAFSLIELLVVIAIIALLSSLLLPAVTSILRGSQLTRGGDKVAALLSLARQTALTKNHTVEVRFYQFTDPETPGETSLSTGKYRAIQAFEIDDTGKATPVGKSEMLPPSIIMDSGATLSTLLLSSQNKTNWTADDPQVKIPRAGLSYNCRVFRFASDGSANLAKTGTPTGSPWFVTLHNMVDGDNLASPPKNYITIQIDPANGSLKTWRP